jgi:hypothetical protein
MGVRRFWLVPSDPLPNRIGPTVGLDRSSDSIDSRRGRSVTSEEIRQGRMPRFLDWGRKRWKGVDGPASTNRFPATFKQKGGLGVSKR